MYLFFFLNKTKFLEMAMAARVPYFHAEHKQNAGPSRDVFLWNMKIIS